MRPEGAEGIRFPGILDDQKKRVRAYFDGDRGWQGEMYVKPDNWFARSIFRRKEYIMQMISGLHLTSSATVIDIGCGSGVYLEELARKGYSCTGIDASPEMIRTTRHRLSEKGIADVRLFPGDIENLPFDNMTFDLVLSVGVLGYLLDEKRAIAEVRRILKPGGYWILNVANVMSLSHLDFYWRKRLMSLFGRVFKGSAEPSPSSRVSFASPWVRRFSPEHHEYRLFHPRRLEKELEEYGFEIHSVFSSTVPFRLLRRMGLVPDHILGKLEETIERFVQKYPVGLIRYVGDSYTCLVRKKDDLPQISRGVNGASL